MLIMNDKHLYFIALLPAEPLRGQIYKLKQQFAEQYHSRHALKSPPHVTLVPPFKMSPESAMTFSTSLASFAHSNHVFNVEIEGYGAFAPRVIYLNILKQDALEKLQKKLLDIGW